MKDLPRIGITMGDPAGIGPEITLKAYMRRLPSHIPIVFGDKMVMETTAGTLDTAPPLSVVSTVENASLVSSAGINLLPVTEFPENAVRRGTVTADTGRAAGRYIEAAIRAALAGKIDAVVTCPIHKRAFHAGGFPYPGHTEMLAALTGTKRFGMMMVSAPLKVALATIHLSLRDVPRAITRTGLKEIIDLTLDTLRRWFGIFNPEICVLGLNPHAGEEGDMGREEIELVSPVIEKFQVKGRHVVGPLPADTAFIKKNLKRFDAFIAMYHDQGLIPFKLLAFETGVNVTMGLPFPRVSVDHGTGLDIAGKGVANPASLRSAIRWAIRFASTAQAEID